MSEHLEHKRNQNPSETREQYKSRDKLEQPKGKFEDLFRTRENSREDRKPSGDVKSSESDRDLQLSPRRTETPADE